jgi:hypothetical protein
MSILDEALDRRLKAAWTDMFITGNGFEFIMKTFMEK